MGQGEGRAPARSFEDLVVWQRAHAFVLGVYRLTATFPREELFGVTSQFRRAAVSIAANIAEGFSKRGAPDKLRYLNIAQGSLEECRYYLLLCRDLGYADPADSVILIDEVAQLLGAYRAKIAGTRP